VQILAISTAIRNACITGDLTTAEELLTQEIDADGNNYNSYANRSFVAARKSDWDDALQDALRVRYTMLHLDLPNFEVLSPSAFSPR
jgi:hypothetical protein